MQLFAKFKKILRRGFRAFQKLLQTRQTGRNNKKLSKNRFCVTIKHCLANSQINSIPEKTAFLQNFSLQNKHKSLRL